MSDHPFSQFLRILGKGPKSRRPLTVEESIEALKMVLDGQVTDKQLGAFLLLMRANGETPEELIGFVQGLRQYYALKSSDSHADLDIAAYAGKWRYPPYFLLSVKLLVENGVKVLLHGDSGQFEDRQYAESFMADLGFYQANSVEEAQSKLGSGEAVYLPLTAFAPALKDILHLKSEIGVRTVFNTAVKMLNPLNAPVAVQGIFHKGVEKLHHAAAQVNGGQTNLVFKGEGGEPEIRPDALNFLFFSRDAAKTDLDEVRYPSFVERAIRPKTWENSHVLKLWQGDVEDVYGEGAVIGSLAAYLMALEHLDVEAALNKAEHWWKNR